MIPALILAFGCLGICICIFLFFLSRNNAAKEQVVKPSNINRDVDLKMYHPTLHPEIYLAKELPDHPFRLVKNGIFCGVCLITNAIRHCDNAHFVHTHTCTVIRKDWKILICKDAILSEYFISLDKAHFRKK